MVTGAAGFIGSHVVDEALGAGHDVVAVVRRREGLPFAAPRSGISLLVADLAKTDAPLLLASEMTSVDAIIHTAAPLIGDDETMEAGGLKPLHAIFEAARSIPQDRPALVLLSSMSIYGLSDLPVGALIDEATLLEKSPEQRDAYCRSKLAQEALARAVTDELRMPLILARPGLVYGADHLWNPHLGVRKAGLVILLADSGEIPVVNVRSCANMLVRIAQLAAHQRGTSSASEALNLLDANLPSRRRYAAALVATGACRGVIDLSWMPVQRCGKFLARLGLSGHLPGLMRPATSAFRLHPVRYTSARLRSRIGEMKQTCFEEFVRQLMKYSDEDRV